jgi:hypothetical protein
MYRIGVRRRTNIGEPFSNFTVKKLLNVKWWRVLGTYAAWNDGINQNVHVSY